MKKYQITHKQIRCEIIKIMFISKKYYLRALIFLNNKFMKHLANTLTISRLVLCVPVAIIFFNHGFNTVGMILFIVACVTDMIDGTIARAATNGKGTKFGQTFDSIADFSMVAVAAFFIVHKMGFSTVSVSIIGQDMDLLLLLCYAGFAYFVLVALVGYIKHKSVNMIIIHTYLMKSLGYILFIWVVLHWVVAYLIFNVADPIAITITNGYTIFVIATIFLLTTEEILISLLLKGPSSDIRTIFRIKQENLKFEARDMD